ncbi:hypothetical protein E2C01_059113 [Portunus trituberculatus]|uniref:Uncharacterized protein n=1 Tax=Portunus trituberculatus TaxID=210409 RepID=A0A5B7GY99_PORTR|nr:hypothetical protein [Portunus trituberculatus]
MITSPPPSPHRPRHRPTTLKVRSRTEHFLPVYRGEKDESRGTRRLPLRYIDVPTAGRWRLGWNVSPNVFLGRVKMKASG